MLKCLQKQPHEFKEDTFMKKYICKIGTMVASLALAVTAADVNSACSFVIHQPQMPAGAEKLSKING